jgi:hypothetical protein
VAAGDNPGGSQTLVGTIEKVSYDTILTIIVAPRGLSPLGDRGIGANLIPG